MRNMSVVRFTQNYRNLMAQQFPELKTLNEKCFVFLGEIPNMPGHCCVAGQSGKVYFGLHVEDFEEIES